MAALRNAFQYHHRPLVADSRPLLVIVAADLDLQDVSFLDWE
jgi:hypothetical protein